MLIVQRPGRSTFSSHTCDFHKRHPDKQWAGCTCSASYGWQEKPPAEWTLKEREAYIAACSGEDHNEIRMRRLEEENERLRKQIKDLRKE